MQLAVEVDTTTITPSKVVLFVVVLAAIGIYWLWQREQSKKWATWADTHGLFPVNQRVTPTVCIDGGPMTTHQHLRCQRRPNQAWQLIAFIVGLCVVASCAQTKDEIGTAVPNPAEDQATAEVLTIEPVAENDIGNGATKDDLEATSSDPGCLVPPNSVTVDSVALGNGRHEVAISLDGIGLPEGRLIDTDGATIATFPRDTEVEPVPGITVVDQSSGSPGFALTVDVTRAIEVSATVKGEVQATTQDGSCSKFWTFTTINSAPLSLSP